MTALVASFTMIVVGIDRWRQ